MAGVNGAGGERPTGVAIGVPPAPVPEEPAGAAPPAAAAGPRDEYVPPDTAAGGAPAAAPAASGAPPTVEAIEGLIVRFGPLALRANSDARRFVAQYVVDRYHPATLDEADRHVSQVMQLYDAAAHDVLPRSGISPRDPLSATILQAAFLNDTGRIVDSPEGMSTVDRARRLIEAAFGWRVQGDSYASMLGVLSPEIGQRIAGHILFDLSIPDISAVMARARAIAAIDTGIDDWLRGLAPIERESERHIDAVVRRHIVALVFYDALHLGLLPTLDLAKARELAARLVELQIEAQGRQVPLAGDDDVGRRLLAMREGIRRAEAAAAGGGAAPAPAGAPLTVAEVEALIDVTRSSRLSSLPGASSAPGFVANYVVDRYHPATVAEARERLEYITRLYNTGITRVIYEYDAFYRDPLSHVLLQMAFLTDRGGVVDSPESMMPETRVRRLLESTYGWRVNPSAYDGVFETLSGLPLAVRQRLAAHILFESGNLDLRAALIHAWEIRHIYEMYQSSVDVRNEVDIYDGDITAAARGIRAGLAERVFNLVIDRGELSTLTFQRVAEIEREEVASRAALWGKAHGARAVPEAGGAAAHGAGSAAAHGTGKIASPARGAAGPGQSFGGTLVEEGAAQAAPVAVADEAAAGDHAVTDAELLTGAAGAVPLVPVPGAPGTLVPGR